MTHTKEDLQIMQGWSLERKVRVTQTRIIEWYSRYDGQVYISFSGGKDSTVLLDIARKLFPDIEAVFVDTGLEYPEIREFIKTFDNVTWLKPKTQFKEVIEKYGYPVISKDVSTRIYYAQQEKTWAINALQGLEADGSKRENAFKERYVKYNYLTSAPFRVSHRCCSIMKEQPLRKYERSFCKHAIIGTMADESDRRLKAWLHTGCNFFDGSNPVSKPMSFWFEQDILQYIKLAHTPYCSVYGEIVPADVHCNQTYLEFESVNPILMTTGCDRTGCMFCMFGCHLEKEPNRFQRMKITHPKQYDYCIRSTEENGLGLGKVLDFIGVKY